MREIVREGLRETPSGRGEQRHVLCGRDDIPPGSVEGFRVGGRRIALARLDDGTFRVVADTCPHQAAQL
ncbi:MAG TPA: Rieske (2Fe-2S) protein, partial [Rubrobacteraceae bacterium]|nr:Rieske (2Fe-2S) protein [Rubrobacteraceae bacterium]